MQRKLWRNTALLAVLMIAMLFLGTGCDKNKVEKSAVNDYIDSRVSGTITAMDERDVKMARNIWSDLSELSVKLKNQGEDELSDDVAALAMSYEKLVSYCNNGEEKYLTNFKADFQTASENLAPDLVAAGYDTNELSVSLASVYK